jgi:hypothetical protein
VRKEDFGRIVPTLKLWVPRLRSLTRDDAQWARFFNAIGPPRKPRTPEPVRSPDRYVWPEPRLRSCQRCGREFYRVSVGGRYCSDFCAEAFWGAARAVRCAQCGEPITARRSDSQFCSVRCCVAAYRERTK